MCQLTSVNELWSTLKSNINSLTETAVSLKSPGRKKVKPWFTRRIKKEFDLRDVAWRMYQRAQSESSYTVYKQQRKKASHMLRKAREAYERDLVASSKGNPKKSFAHVQSNKRLKNQISVLKDRNGNAVVDPASQSKLISAYFATAYRHDNGSHPPPIFK